MTSDKQQLQQIEKHLSEISKRTNGLTGNDMLVVGLCAFGVFVLLILLIVVKAAFG